MAKAKKEIKKEGTVDMAIVISKIFLPKHKGAAKKKAASKISPDKPNN